MSSKSAELSYKKTKDKAMVKPYSELVAQAERAVAEVKDAELRRVAFERVLNDLLHDADSSSLRRRQSGSPQKKVARAAAGGAKRAGPQSHIEEMAADGFFKKPRSISEVKAELENRGHHIPLTSLSGPMQKLCQRKVLRLQKSDGKTFSYSNW